MRFGWLLLGVVAGAAAVVALYLLVTGQADAPPPEPSAPAVRMQPPPLPADPEPPVAAPAPATAPPAAPARPADPDREAQIADDAAATGMTGPAVAGDTAVNPPTN